ncbi:MAG: hypothetical protein IPP22_09080 [Nitrosomonas sp.]|nr:hypothetical protein [Nitrosomonas sp.]
MGAKEKSELGFLKNMHGGLEIINLRIHESPTDWENALIALVIEQYGSKKPILMI